VAFCTAAPILFSGVYQRCLILLADDHYDELSERRPACCEVVLLKDAAHMPSCIIMMSVAESSKLTMDIVLPLSFIVILRLSLVSSHLICDFDLRKSYEVLPCQSWLMSTNPGGEKFRIISKVASTQSSAISGRTRRPGQAVNLSDMGRSIANTSGEFYMISRSHFRNQPTGLA